MNSLLPAPPSRLVEVSWEIRESLREAFRQPTPSAHAWDWAEKLRRFVGVYAGNLGRVTTKRFGSEGPMILAWMAEILLSAAQRRSCGSLPCDPSFLNAALVAADAISDRRKHPNLLDAEQAVADLWQWHGSGGKNASLRLFSPSFEYVQGRWAAESTAAPKIVVIAPSPFSLSALSVLGIAEKLSIPVAGLVVRRFTTQRFLQEYRRDGVRLLHKIWRKLILRGDENRETADISLKELAKTVAPQTADATTWCRKRGIPTLRVIDLNSEECRSWLGKIRPDVGLFCGGGLVTTDTQKQFSLGIINAHMGHLPYYRGMDVVQWPILEGRFANVGATAHFMDAGIDTGPLLQVLSVRPTRYRTIGALRNAVSALLPLLLIDTALGIGSGRIEPRAQSTCYPLYFYMHEKLLKIARDRLASAPISPTSNEDAATLFTNYLNELK